MRRETIQRILRWQLGLLLLGLSACGGTHSASPLLNPASSAPAAQVSPSTTAGDSLSPRNTLQLSIPALAHLAPGDEFTATIEITTVEPLFQASLRLLFDPLQLEPLTAETGELGKASVALTRADQALRMNDSGFVPFSFTGLPGTSGLLPQRTRLLTVRFRLLKEISANAGLRLANDPAYLQLRAPDGRRLSFDLSEEVAAR